LASESQSEIKLKKNKIAVLMLAALPGCVIWCGGALAAVEIIDARDTLDRALAGPELMGGSDAPLFDIFVRDRQAFDSNVFRLSNDVNVSTAVGPGADKQDYINSPGAGLDDQWAFGKQVVNLELRVDDNLYAQNTGLNNVSTDDRLRWNWGLGGTLSGQVGVNFMRALASFVNTDVYTRNVYQRTDYFATGRYQVGPHWAIYGGVLASDFSLAESATQGNDSRQKSIDGGFDFVTDVDDTIGIDYRYTDAHYPNEINLDNTLFLPDYTEDRARFVIKHSFSDKTAIDVGVGYMKRDYSNSQIGSFSGPTWRGALGWQPTQKTQVIVATWRNLQAYLTDQSNYYRATGESISPVWNATEKITVSVLLSHENQNYIGSTEPVPGQPSERDTVYAEVATISYLAIRSLTIEASYRHENRDSNLPLREYSDELASVGVRFQF
jgi:Putative beta-barrel porin 2